MQCHWLWSYMEMTKECALSSLFCWFFCSSWWTPSASGVLQSFHLILLSQICSTFELHWKCKIWYLTCTPFKAHYNSVSFWGFCSVQVDSRMHIWSSFWPCVWGTEWEIRAWTLGRTWIIRVWISRKGIYNRMGLGGRRKFSFISSSITRGVCAKIRVTFFQCCSICFNVAVHSFLSLAVGVYLCLSFQCLLSDLLMGILWRAMHLFKLKVNLMWF